MGSPFFYRVPIGNIRVLFALICRQVLLRFTLPGAIVYPQ